MNDDRALVRSAAGMDTSEESEGRKSVMLLHQDMGVCNAAHFALIVSQMLKEMGNIQEAKNILEKFSNWINQVEKCFLLNDAPLYCKCL